jgi:hypothetical protein
MTLTIAPKGNTSPADIRLDGTTDMAVLAKHVSQPNADVRILAGVVNLNGGGSGDPSGGGYLRPGKGATITGEPGTVLEARSSIVRVTLDKPGVHLKQLRFKGKGHVQWFETGADSVLEDVTVDQSDDTGRYYDLNRNCTAAFLFYARRGTTLKGVTLRRCQAIKSYHHGFSMHVYGAQEGATFQDFLFDDCRAIACGSGLLTPRDWSTGFNTADTGHLVNIHLVDCGAVDCWQSGFHCDGNWTGHAQNVQGLYYERCLAVRCGQRCSPNEKERFCSGFYGQVGQYTNCRSENCAVAGFGIKNERPGTLVMRGCSDIGSKYGLICEYAAPGARIEFVSTGAKKRAFQGQVTAGGTLDLKLIDPPRPAVTLGRTARIDYLDCPGHAAQVTGKYDKLGYTIDGSSIMIWAFEKPVVDVWPTSRLRGSVVYVPLDTTTLPEIPPDIPHPIPQGSLYIEDGEWIWYQAPEGRPTQWQPLPDDILTAGGIELYARDGAVWAGARGIPARTIGFLPDGIREFYRDVKGVV